MSKIRSGAPAETHSRVAGERRFASERPRFDDRSRVGEG